MWQWCDKNLRRDIPLLWPEAAMPNHDNSWRDIAPICEWKMDTVAVSGSYWENDNDAQNASKRHKKVRQEAFDLSNCLLSRYSKQKNAVTAMIYGANSVQLHKDLDTERTFATVAIGIAQPTKAEQAQDNQWTMDSWSVGITGTIKQTPPQASTHKALYQATEEADRQYIRQELWRHTEEHKHHWRTN